MTTREALGPHRSTTLGGAPAGLTWPAAVASAFLVIPVTAVVLRAPWASLGERLTSTTAQEALRLSVATTLLSTLLCLVFGVPLAWVLARTDFRGRSAVRALVVLPLVLPPVVGGVALLLAFGRNGVVGHWLDVAFGITIPFTTAAVVLAQTFVALPFLVISVEGALRASDERYDEAAATLGASRWLTFRRVTLPLAWPGIVSGAVLCWARALGEFGATITFAGSFPGTTQTLPPAVYLALRSEPDTAIALSLLLIVVSVTVLALLRERWLSGVSA
ncbi:MAG: molybdate ABC transporter permease subunit [Propionibacteriales bacterium]|nr:molybdate ABC transporter permease subunit [Propionibacteriales bacterium]